MDRRKKIVCLPQQATEVFGRPPGGGFFFCAVAEQALGVVGQRVS